MNDTTAQPRALRRQAVEQAAEWVVRLQDEDLSYEQIEEWNRWMEADREHARAFEDVSLMWQASSELPHDLLPASRQARHEMPLPAAPAHASTDAPTRRRRRPLRWAAAAAMTGIALLGLVSYHRDRDATDAVRVFATAKGELRQVVLEDHSRVNLGPDSQIRVQIGPRRRQIELTGGQAYFAVAKDAARPFEVRARGLIAQALGTEFSVDHGEGAVTVTVTEGRVQVNDLSPDSARPTGGEKSVQLTAGQQTQLDADGGLSIPRAVNAADAVAWREGSVVYASEPLGNVVADLNRYSSVPVVLADPALARQPVTGRWLTTDVDAWLAGMAGAFSLNVLRYPDRIVLTQRKDAQDG